jgi:hypothetical protein
VRQAVAIALLVLISSAGTYAQSDSGYIIPVQIRLDTLQMKFDYAAFLTENDSAALRQGDDLVLVCRLELWQKRSLWFDRLRATRSWHIGLSYDRWEEKYSISTREPDGWVVSHSFDSLTAIMNHLQHQLTFNFVLDAADWKRESYLAYSVEVKYITAEKLEDIAGWLTGGSADSGESKSLPDKALALIVNSAGIRNRSYLQSSEPFAPTNSPTRIKFPRLP